jgi:hypothetical protein
MTSNSALFVVALDRVGDLLAGLHRNGALVDDDSIGVFL